MNGSARGRRRINISVPGIEESQAARSEQVMKPFSFPGAAGGCEKASTKHAGNSQVSFASPEQERFGIAAVCLQGALQDHGTGQEWEKPMGTAVSGVKVPNPIIMGLSGGSFVSPLLQGPAQQLCLVVGNSPEASSWQGREKKRCWGREVGQG